MTTNLGQEKRVPRWHTALLEAEQIQYGGRG